MPHLYFFFSILFFPFQFYSSSPTLLLYFLLPFIIFCFCALGLTESEIQPFLVEVRPRRLLAPRLGKVTFQHEQNDETHVAFYFLLSCFPLYLKSALQILRNLLSMPQGSVNYERRECYSLIIPHNSIPSWVCRKSTPLVLFTWWFHRAQLKN